MKFLILILMLFSFACKDEADVVNAEDSLTLYTTDKAPALVVAELKNVIQKKGLTLFAEIDHAKNARQVDLELPPNTLLIFGKPEAGTKILKCDRRMGIELPLKIITFQGIDGLTYTGFWQLGQYAEYYELEDCEQLLENMNETILSIITEALDQKSEI